MSKSLILLVMFLVGAFALYESQVGYNDWHSKNIGQIDNVFFGKRKIYFSSDSTNIGALNAELGNIDYMQSFKEKTFIWNAQYAREQGQVILLENSNIVIYDFIKNIFFNYQDLIKIQETPRDYYIANDIIYILFDQSIVMFNQQNSNELYKLEKYETFSQIIVSKNNFVFISQENLPDTNNFRICARVVDKQISLNDLDAQNLQKECIQVSSQRADSVIYTQSFIASYDGSSLNGVQFESKVQNFRINLKGGQEDLKIRGLFETSLISLSYKQNSNESVHYLYSINLSDNSLVQLAEEKSASSDSVTFFERHQDEESFYPEEIYLIQKSGSTIQVSRLNYSNKSTKLVFSSSVGDFQGAIASAWFKIVDQQFLVLFQDEAFNTYILSSKESKILWTRNDGLAHIEKLVTIDYTFTSKNLINSYHQHLDQKGLYNPIWLIPAFLKRLTSEARDLVQNFNSQVNYMINFVKNLVSVRSLNDIVRLNEISIDPEGDEEYDIQYGYKQLLIGITKERVVVAVDSQNKQVIWTSFEAKKKVENDATVLGIFTIEDRHAEQFEISVLVVFHSASQGRVSIFRVEPQSGIVKQVGSYNISKIISVFKIPHKYLLEQTTQIHQIIAIVDGDLNINIFPKRAQSISKIINKELFFYNYKQNGSEIIGYKLISDKFVSIWNIQFPKNEVIIAVQDASQVDYEAPIVATYDDYKVLLKNIDYTNIALLTKTQGKTQNSIHDYSSLNLYVVNGKSGRVLFNGYQQHVELNLPINLLYDENNILVSFYNPMQSMYEIWTVEGFSNKIQLSLVKLLTNYYIKGSAYEKVNLYEQDIDLIFLEQKYGFPLGVKFMEVSPSKLSITKRNLIIVTSQDQLYSLDRNMISARRAVKEKNIRQSIGIESGFDSSELPPFSYIIPTKHLFIISYNLNIQNIQNIIFSPTNLESTTIMIAYGGDLFVTPISPERTFDKLNDDFNYIFLIATTLAVIIATFVLSSLAKDSKVFKLMHK